MNRRPSMSMSKLQQVTLSIASGWLASAAAMKWVSTTTTMPVRGADWKGLILLTEIVTAAGCLVAAGWNGGSRRPMRFDLGGLRGHLLVGLGLLFCGFAVHSGFAVVNGDASCGCYGNWSVPPLLSFVATAAFSVTAFAVSGKTNHTGSLRSGPPMVVTVLISGRNNGHSSSDRSRSYAMRCGSAHRRCWSCGPAAAAAGRSYPV